MENHVFISYSRTDQRYVDRLAEWLQTAGIPIWIDHNIDYGTTWTQTIEQNLDTAGAIIVVMSSSARESVWVSREITRGERKGKRIFPLLLSGEPLLQFETTQYEDVTDGSLPSPKFKDSVASTLGVVLRGLGSDLLDVVASYRESGVLILGRFTAERILVQHAMRDSLRQRGFIPVVFDFELPPDLTFRETLLLFSLAVRFIIVDLTDAGFAQELSEIIPFVRVPVMPIIEAGQKPFAMFSDFFKLYPWVLQSLVYTDQEELIANIDSLVVQRAEDTYQKLQAKRKLELSDLLGNASRQ
jgi:TIR domain